MRIAKTYPTITKETITKRGLAHPDAISPSGCRRPRWRMPLLLHPSVPATERGAQVIIQHLHPHLEQSMCPLLRPPHLLLLHHPLAHYLIDR
jgi:hypothetical protein